MHTLAIVLIPFDSNHAKMRPLAARDAAAAARIDTLLYRYEQREDGRVWGVDVARGFKFDWWAVGGRWKGWGRDIRTLMKKQGLRRLPRQIPRCLERNAVRTEELARVRLTSFDLLPIAVITPHGEWEECKGNWGWGKSSVRERKLKARWVRRFRALMRAYPSCLAVAVDYHW